MARVTTLVGFYEFSNPARLVVGGYLRRLHWRNEERLQLHGGDSVGARASLRKTEPDFHLRTGTFNSVRGHPPHAEIPQLSSTELQTHPEAIRAARIMVYDCRCRCRCICSVFGLREADSEEDRTLACRWRSPSSAARTRRSALSARWYRPEEFLQLCSGPGSAGKLVGCAVSINEIGNLAEAIPGSTRPQPCPDEHLVDSYAG